MAGEPPTPEHAFGTPIVGPFVAGVLLRDLMPQTRRLSPRSLARVAGLFALVILAFTTCKLDKLMGPAAPPPTKLVFQAHPQNTLANQTLAPPIKVYVANAAGDTVPDVPTLVTIGITAGSGTA